MIRKEIAELVSLGEFPSSENATQEDLDRRAHLLSKISMPVSSDEAEALMSCFGPDDCYEGAWTLLHLIETAPSLPLATKSLLDKSEWLTMVWKGPREQQ